MLDNVNNYIYYLLGGERGVFIVIYEIFLKFVMLKFVVLLLKYFL